MQRIWADYVEKNIPKMNPAIMRGLAYHYTNEIEDYIDRVVRSNAKSFPSFITYEGLARCGPIAEYLEVTRERNNERVYDLAQSSLYIVKLFFKVHEEMIEHMVFLPFIKEAGIFHLSGSRYHIKPVLTDKVISPGNGYIFVRILQNKITFFRTAHKLIIDGRRETMTVVWSQIYHKKSASDRKVPATTNAKTSLAHYLLAKYGFKGAFQRACGFVPVVGDEEINEENYPNTDWVIVQTSHSELLKPPTFKGDVYFPTTIRLAIPKDKWNERTKPMIVGFFYVIDHFPTYVKSSYINNGTVQDERDRWIYLLGHILKSGHYSQGKLHADMSEHLMSLDDHLDDIYIEKLFERGYHIKDFYELMMLIMSEFANFVMDANNNNLSVYGKNLDILYHLLYDITSGISMAKYQLRKLANRPATFNRPSVTKAEVEKLLRKNIRLRAIFGLSGGKIVTENVSYSGDHMYPKITSKIMGQEGSSGSSRGKKQRVTLGPDRYVHVSMMEAGSILFLPKSAPTAMTIVNPYVTLDLKTSTIIPNPKLVPIIAQTAELLKLKQDGNL